MYTAKGTARTASGPPLPTATPIAQALACYDDTYSNRFKVTPDRHLRIARPKFKQLVLDIIPNASVRQNSQHAYECFIGEHHISWHCVTGQHRAPDKAWLCLARFVNSPDFDAADATGAFK